MAGYEIVIDEGPEPSPALQRKKQVLLVNNNRAAREALSGMLMALGCNVTLAGNGFDGANILFTSSHDLAIIDLEMPERSVWELSRIFKERSPKTSVIVATEFSEYSGCGKFSPNSVDVIIPKPFKSNEMERLVQMLLGDET
jgi:DNA-binding NtrC family response regulator